MMQYVEHTIPGETLIDSDRESNKSEEGDVAKEQRMFIWNQKFEVCVCVYISDMLQSIILVSAIGQGLTSHEFLSKRNLHAT